MNLLVLIGSLRTESTNARLARAAVAGLPTEITVRFATGLAEIPFYDEDLDTPDTLPVTAADWRDQVTWADALLLVTPEYNGTLSAVAKNAIDWASRPREAAPIAGMPALVLSASGSPRGGQWAREDAIKTLRVAGAEPLTDHLGVPSSYAAFDENEALRDPELAGAVQRLVAGLLDRMPVAA